MLSYQGLVQRTFRPLRQPTRTVLCDALKGGLASLGLAILASRNPMVVQTVAMAEIDEVWARIERHAGSEFKTRTGLVFTYRVPGCFLRVSRDGREVNRSLSRTNFEKALVSMPTDRPSDLKERQGSAYTWGILMDRRIRGSDW